jgi:hypothetical protein
MIFKINGETPNVNVISLQRAANVLDGSNAGRLKNGDMMRDIIGTYYNYTIEVSPKASDTAAYNDLYETITAPVESYPVELPFGQSTLKFDAYTASAEDSLRYTNGTRNHWRGLKFTMTAKAPQKTRPYTSYIAEGSGAVLRVDGHKFRLGITSLQRKNTVLDDDNSGRLMSGVMERSIIGSYYNYTLGIEPIIQADYDTFYELISSPMEYHTLTVPYGSGTTTFKAYVSNVTDNLKAVHNSKNYWGGMKVNFIAMSPQRRP